MANWKASNISLSLNNSLCHEYFAQFFTAWEISQTEHFVTSDLPNDFKVSLKAGNWFEAILDLHNYEEGVSFHFGNKYLGTKWL